MGIHLKPPPHTLDETFLGENLPLRAISVIEMASEATFEQAYQWLCNQRKERSHNNSVWDLRFHWERLKSELQHQLRTGTYQLSPLRSFQINNETISSWDAIDSLVLKALTITIQPLFSSAEFEHCTHLKNGGGIHSALEKVAKNQGNYQHLLKSDAYHYYESIDHDVLLAALKEYIGCPILLSLVTQYCQRLESRDGSYYHFKQGIPMGCPLSPLMAALYLKPLDDEMSKHGFYVRFMDDWVIMVKTKRQLRRVIKLTHQILSRLKLKMHPDKTYLGWIKKGFDFLGIHFGDTPTISKTSLENHQTKLAQRYAHGASDACIGNYIARWASWCASVLKRCSGKNQIINSRGTEANRSIDLMGLLKEQDNEKNRQSRYGINARAM